MRHLTHDQQMVVHLRFLEEWSHEDVAEFLGKTNEACRALQYRALDALKKVLARDPNEINHGA